MAIMGANLTFGCGEKFLGVQKASGGRQNGYKGRQINVRWWETFLGVQKVQGEQQAYKKNQKKVATYFIFFLETVKFLYFVGAPFELNGRAPFKLVTPMLDRRGL